MNVLHPHYSGFKAASRLRKKGEITSYVRVFVLLLGSDDEADSVLHGSSSIEPVRM